MSVDPIPVQGEEGVRHALAQQLSKALPSYTVKEHANLLYKVVVLPDGSYEPKSGKLEGLTRGESAFQTDLLILNDRRWPLVVLELKHGRLSTHAVLTYSSKAARHKELYPYLRYGLCVVGLASLPRRFFTHNSAIDFAVALPALEGSDNLTVVLRRQIEFAERLAQRAFEGRSTAPVVAFETEISFTEK